MKDIVSIIVPVYNVEKYLQRCVNSLVNQTHRNLEIILVDDGSKDGSPELCDELAKSDSRIKVVHKQNGGLSSARNAGLEAVTGDFITFVDSDDWISLDAMAYGLSLIDKYQADVYEYEYVYVSSESDKIKSKKERIEVFHDKDVLQYYMQSSTVRGNYSVCICIFKKELLDGIRFRIGTIAEDIEFKYRVYSRCKTLVYSNQAKYFYYQSGDSLSTGGVKKRDFQLFDVAENLVNLAKDENYGTIRYLSEVKRARTPMSLLCKIALYGFSDTSINHKETIDNLMIMNRKYLKIIIGSPMPFSRKIVATLFAINYKMTAIIMNLSKAFVKI